MGKAFDDALNGPADPSANVEGTMGVGDIYNAYGDYSAGGNDQNLYNTLGQQSNNYQLSNDASIAGNIAAQNRAARAMPDMPYEQMFPSANNNINKGSYSGSIVGSVPIFAPSQLTPFGMIDRRNAAMNKAAADVAQQNADFSKTKAPETKLFAVQGQLDEQFSKGLDQWTANAKKQYGNNWSSALKEDPNFNKWMQSMDTLAKYHTGISDTMGDIDAQMKSGDFVASPELRKIMADTKSGIANLQNPFDPKGHDVGTNLLKMRAVYDLDKATNNALDEVVKTVTDSYPGISSQGIYDLITKKTTTGVDDSRIAAISKEVYDSKYSDGSGFTQQQVYDALLAKLGKKATTYTNSTVSTRGAGVDEKKEEETSVSNESETVNFFGHEGGVVTEDGITFDPTTVNVPQSTKAVDPATGKSIDVAANAKIVVGKSFNVLVDSKGNIVPNETNADPGRTKWVTYVSGTIDTGTTSATAYGTGGSATESKKTTQTVWMPAAEVQNELTKFNADGSYKSGVRTDIQGNKAKARTDKFRIDATNNPEKYSGKGKVDAGAPQKAYTNFQTVKDKDGNNVTAGLVDGKWYNSVTGEEL